MQRLHGKLDGLFAVVRPVQTLFIAVDGPAAWAKVTEQRKRRRHTVRSDGKSSSRGGGRNARGRGRHRARQSHGPNAFSRNLLTPGLPFMDELTAALEHWCSDWMRSGGCLAECSASVVSGSSVVGEGEHKMLVRSSITTSPTYFALTPAGPLQLRTASGASCGHSGTDACKWRANDGRFSEC